MKLKKLLLTSSIAFFGISAPIAAVTTTQASAATKKVKLTKAQKATKAEVKKIKSATKSGKVHTFSKAKIGQTYSKFTKSNKRTKGITKIDTESFTAFDYLYKGKSATVYFTDTNLNSPIIGIDARLTNKATKTELTDIFGKPVSESSFGSQSTVTYASGKYKVKFISVNYASSNSELAYGSYNIY